MHPKKNSMLKFLTSIILMIAGATAFSQISADHYRFSIDLVNVNDDKIKVELVPPAIASKTITYHIPKIVPGTYSEDDYGRFIENFTATDKTGKKLEVVKSDVNSWTISNANKLAKIAYWVNDSFDDTSRQVIFEPAGSNIQKDSNYVINNHCYIGYFDGKKNIPYEVNISHRPDFYGSTALIDVDKSNTKDKFVTETYNRIVDNPIMYNVPDTSVIKVGSTDVLISVYSPNKKISAEFLAGKIAPMLAAQTKYLGGRLPVDKYAFIIYLTPRRGRSGSIGALEHSYSSFYFLIESNPEALSTFVLDAAAHEFFHIITPLSIHSDEIQNFDFNAPKMSRHLWLYEGSTEYHAHMVQEKYGLISPEEFLKRMSDKITSSRRSYNDSLPFTEMSRNVLGPYGRQFGNVYQKGALINMCIDILLLQHSNGRTGLLKLIRDLSQQYGKQRGFVDSTFFDVLEKLTFPQLRQFLDTYVAGTSPLPIKDIMNIVGINYTPKVETKDSSFTLGGVVIRYSQSAGRARVLDISQINDFGRRLGWQVNDEILSINGETLTATNTNTFLRDFGSKSKAGDSLVINVIRKSDGKETPLQFRSTMIKFPVFKFNVLEFNPAASAQQLLLRNAWLKPNDMQR